MIVSQKQRICNIAMYLRLSKDDGDKEESESISNQRKIILDYIDKNFIYDNVYEYVDDGVSGATFNRPAFNKMISELKINQINLVITKNLARFGRNYIEAGDYIEMKFPNLNIRYIAILDNIDNFQERIENEFAPIKGAFNEMYCKETSKNVKKSKRKRMKEGFYACNVAPFGYKKDSEQMGKLVIDEPAAIIVRRIFKLKSEGLTIKNISNLLNKEKVITPSEYLKIKGFENNTNQIWTRSMVNRILNNKVYLGMCLRGKTQNISYKSKKRIHVNRNEQIITENTHDAIISEEIFNKVHNNNKYGNVTIKKNTYETPFLEYMYCGKCNHKLTRRKSRNFVSVHCVYRNESDIICNNKELYRYDELEEKILENIKINFEEFFKKRNSSSAILKRSNLNKIEKIKLQKNEVTKKQSALRFKISRLYNDRLQEIIDEESYKKQYFSLINERKKLEEKQEEYDREIEELNQDNKNADKYKKVKALLKKMNKNCLNADEIGELIDKIVIYDNTIHIYYRFKGIKERVISE